MKLGFVKCTIPRPPNIPIPPVTATFNVVNIEIWETCNNLVISWIMSSVSDSIAKSVMFIGSASEIWSYLATRFSLSNGSRKYKLSKDTFGISQQGSSQEESQKDVFHGSTVFESTALFSKSGGKDKCSICGFKWNPPERCWEKVGYPVWHHKYKPPGKPNQPRTKELDKSRGNGTNVNHRRTAASVTSGLGSFTFTFEQFENLMRSVLKDVTPGVALDECTDDDLELLQV
ncbi:hypothetical protein CTI12_AA382710 [Artemisia annua]|uniref:Retrotransposon Copia-like N-terminal domain-containing protein n=1 Tax=Artemisia annua TaxID=35608 RepID=A0A2U1MGD9_ARTAN|nr:hypothetical protein CTI12_AA382710 [Artemisia annua]